MIAFFVKILIRKQHASQTHSWDVSVYWIQLSCDIIPNVYNLEQEIPNQAFQLDKTSDKKVRMQNTVDPPVVSWVDWVVQQSSVHLSEEISTSAVTSAASQSGLDIIDQDQESVWFMK